MIPVAIVGGGVGGLACALAFAAEGWPSVVFESRSTNRNVDRGDVLQPAVLPLLAAWRVSDLLSQEAIGFEQFRIANEIGDILLTIDAPQLLGKEYHFTAIRHADFLEVLRAGAARTGLIEVTTGERCVTLIEEHGRVVGVKTDRRNYYSRLTIVAAGAHASIVKRHFNAIRSYQYDTAFANVCVRELDEFRNCGYYVLSPHGVIVLAPLPGGRQRIGLQLRTEELNNLSTPSYLTTAIAERYAPLAEVELELVDRPRIYRLQRSVRRNLWIPGAALVGDAAHQVHPVGGQGMNLAIRDAALLSALVSGVDCRRPDALDTALSEYAALRSREIRHVLRRTHLLGLAAESRSIKGLCAAVSAIDKITVLKRAVVQAMMDVR